MRIGGWWRAVARNGEPVASGEGYRNASDCRGIVEAMFPGIEIREAPMPDPSLDTPTPGSDEALELGCRCPVLHNAHGRGAMGTSGDDAEFWTNAACPLHGATTMPDPSPDTPSVCPTAPDGYVACRTTHGPGASSTVQVTHLVRLDDSGSNGGRPTMCGLTRFDKRSPDGWAVIELAAIPGWSMGGGGISGPGITQKACQSCWSAAEWDRYVEAQREIPLADERWVWAYGGVPVRGPIPAACPPAPGSSSPDVTALTERLRDWPYVRPAFVRSEAEQAADALEAQAARITELERWKAEALVVLGQWDEVWEALGRPGPLGSSKAVEALTEAHRLRATDPPADVHPRHPRQETT